VDAIVRAHPVRALMHELLQQGRCVELMLPYLSEAGVSAYLTRRFGQRTMTAVMAGILRQRTNGNPLFMITMVDDLVRQGRLGGVEDSLEWSRGLEAVVSRMPESLRQLLEQEIERLTFEDQMLLEAASAVGTEFSAAAVERTYARASHPLLRCPPRAPRKPAG
jgi:predicted ATPase